MLKVHYLEDGTAVDEDGNPVSQPTLDFFEALREYVRIGLIIAQSESMDERANYFTQSETKQ